jgi:catechol 2,3-dioxygenase-like lactoylglutathione lyase family enzyme
MFTTSRAFSGFAVPDTEQARAFYGDVLGMETAVLGEEGLLELRVADGHAVLVYPKPDFVPATYTVLNFPVDDIEAAVDDLIGRGVSFERYEGAEQDERGIAHGEPRIAWFKDPAGNILSVLQG